MPFTTSPNMGLIIPGVGTELGPEWATDLNASLTTIDSHNHTTGEGVQIPTAGININSALTFNDFDAVDLRSVRFFANTNPLSGGLDLDCVYVAGVDLWYNDGNGNQIRITQNGQVGTSTPIPGLTPPASLTYSSITDSFIFQSGIGIPATLDAGPVIVRQLNLPYSGVTIEAPSGLTSGGYDLTLPTALPAANNTFLTMSTTGQVSDSITVDGTTVVISGNKISAVATAAPNIQKFGAGSGTYTPSSGVLYAIAYLRGSGGGGGPGYTSSTGGGNGGATTLAGFASAGGGSGGVYNGQGGAGGTNTITSGTVIENVPGSNGTGSSIDTTASCSGGPGGQCAGGTAGGGGFGVGNVGGSGHSGGGGGGGGASSGISGAGGGGGGFVAIQINSPTTATYTVASGGAGGTGNTAGGPGGDGELVIAEYF